MLLQRLCSQPAAVGPNPAKADSRRVGNRRKKRVVVLVP